MPIAEISQAATSIERAGWGYRRLGDIDMRISRLGLGGWGFGGVNQGMTYGRQDDADSIATVHRGVDLGINWIDTAPVYGHGHSEEVIGRALKLLPASDRPMVFTKTGYWWDPDDHLAFARRLVSASMVMRDIDGSLTRLGLDHVDLLQVHAEPEDDHDVEEYWDALARVKASGKARAIGLCNHSTLKIARADHHSPVDALQLQYSPIRRAAGGDQIPWAQSRNISVLAWGPLYSGLLSGTMSAASIANLPEEDFRRTEPEFNERLERNLRFVDTLRSIADLRNASVASVAVRWVLSAPGVSAAIIGPRYPHELDAYFSGNTMDLTSEEIAAIDRAIDENGIGNGPSQFDLVLKKSSVGNNSKL